VGGRARRSRHDVRRYRPSDAGNLESGLRWEVAEISFQNHSGNTEPVMSAAPRLLLSNVHRSVARRCTTSPHHGRWMPGEEMWVPCRYADTLAPACPAAVSLTSPGAAPRDRAISAHDV
jgi:hypothetical protein